MQNDKKNPESGQFSARIFIQYPSNFGVFINLRVAPPVLRTWANKRKLDEEMSKHAGLAEQNGFGRAFFHKILRLVPLSPGQLWHKSVKYFNLF